MSTRNSKRAASRARGNGAGAELARLPVVAAALQAEASPVPWPGGRSPGRSHVEGLSFLDLGGRFMMRCKIDVGSEAVLTTEDGKVFVLDVSHEIWERDGKRQLPGAVADGLRCRPNEPQSWKVERRVVSGQLTRLEALEWIAAHLERSIPPMLREELKVCVTLEDGALRRRKAMASGRKDGGR